VYIELFLLLHSATRKIYTIPYNYYGIYQLLFNNKKIITKCLLVNLVDANGANVVCGDLMNVEPFLHLQKAKRKIIIYVNLRVHTI